MRKEYLQSFYKRFDFPGEAVASLNADYDKIASDNAVFAAFEAPVILYESGTPFNFDDGVKAAEEAAERVGVHKYAADMLFICMLTEQLGRNFVKGGKSDELFFDTVYDITCKLHECHKMYGIWGTFVVGWYEGLFEGYRYAFGRLQFEDRVRHGDDLKLKNITVSDGEHYLDMHIPSRGRLAYEDVLASYKAAYEYFKDFREDGLVPIFTESWLLDVSLPTILPQGSNIVRFASDFRLYRQTWNDRDPFPDAWRVFYDDTYKKQIADYSEDTAMKKAIKQHLMNGGHIGEGYGYIVMDKNGMAK